MNQISDIKQKQISKQVQVWFETFRNTEGYACLTQAEQEESSFIIEVFAEMMFNYFELEPSNWNPKALEECCLDLLPRKVSAGNEFYDAVEPVLTAFFNFLQEIGAHNNASSLITRLKKVSGPMREAANSPSAWGMSKQLVMGAKQEGIDLSDQNAINRYIESYNAALPGINGSAEKSSKIGRNEPCPCGSGKKYKKCCGMGGQVIPFPNQDR